MRNQYESKLTFYIVSNKKLIRNQYESCRRSQADFSYSVLIKKYIYIYIYIYIIVVVVVVKSAKR